jgi:hypothetical protein
MEKAIHASENPADVKAAEKMAKLFDEIKKDNLETSNEFVHSLNVFFSRLLFCYFAEDTNIFEVNQFSHAVESHTRTDGSDLDAYLNRLFGVLNTQVDKRGNIPNYLNTFPYVNGGLFKEGITCPKFSTKSRQLLIDCGDSNDWSAINPDIFGSMFQAVISPEHRGGLGAHYTSVPNIMKVIEPLFLNELKEAFEDAKGNKKKLTELLNRISKIKLFDPACGSGNFLIIAYKELRRLEMQILKELGGFVFSGIQLNNFYGIELDDFAHEIAKLSLWLAEHQMNVEFFNEFGRTNPTLPLQEAGQIICGNACRLNWEVVCPKNEGDEIYIMGNPPYLGSRNQDKIQKSDMDFTFKGVSDYKKLDYIACWFYLSSRYIAKSISKYAFVTTNSITQGEQVPILWPLIFEKRQEIVFAHQSFKWTNNAKNEAAVIVAIIGVGQSSNKLKNLYNQNLLNKTPNINPYLISAPTILIKKRIQPLSDFPKMIYGNEPRENGNLMLSSDEKELLCNKFDNFEKFIKRVTGAYEFINDVERYCLWGDVLLGSKNIDIEKRLELVKAYRLTSSRDATKEYSTKPHLFTSITYKDKPCLIIPVVSSEFREYLPIGFLTPDYVVLNSAQVIYDFEPFLFSILNSLMHMSWMKMFSGRLKTDFRYSSQLVYNTFPFPLISNQRKEELTQCTFRILEEREKHPEKTLAQLYDPDKMPEGLKEAHRLNDEALERCYRSTPFNSDEERLEYLFKLYEKMIQEEKEKGTLFEAEKKTRKKK